MPRKKDLYLYEYKVSFVLSVVVKGCGHGLQLKPTQAQLDKRKSFSIWLDIVHRTFDALALYMDHHAFYAIIISVYECSCHHALWIVVVYLVSRSRFTYFLFSFTRMFITVIQQSISKVYVIYRYLFTMWLQKLKQKFSLSYRK